ncbi:hypothetical protein N7475_005152 [Penicillium sp. IBT 31633x]|nr:hypothetical protein N7475_005152 [Penicillium sp. IBT 31633x]
MTSPRVTKSPAKKPQPGRPSNLLDKHHEFLLLCIEGSTSTRLGITANAARKRFNRLKARLDEMREYEEGGRENDTNDDATMEDDNANIEADPKQTAD